MEDDNKGFYGLSVRFMAERRMGPLDYVYGGERIPSPPDWLKRIAPDDRRRPRTAEKAVRYEIGCLELFGALNRTIVVDCLATGASWEGRPIYLTRDDLSRWLAVCKAVREDSSRADELLPIRLTDDGGCVGPREYDEAYFRDVDDAVEFFEAVLREVDFDEWEVLCRIR